MMKPGLSRQAQAPSGSLGVSQGWRIFRVSPAESPFRR